MIGNGTASLSRAIGATLFLTSFLAGLAPAQSVETELARKQIYLGEAVTYRVHVLNAEPESAPDLQLEDMGVEYRGQGSQISSFNFNSRNMSATRKLTYEYKLVPEKSGRLVIPGPTVELPGGETLQGPKRTLRVIPPEKQDLVIGQIALDPPQVYPLQPFLVTLKLFVHVLPDEYRDQDPLRFLADQPPALEVPWVEEISGLRSNSLSDWLGSRKSNNAPRGQTSWGFTINGLQEAQRSFFLFDRQTDRTIVFDLKGRPATEQDVDGTPDLAGRAADYWVYSLEREYVPESLGNYRFGPVSIKGQFLDKELRNGRGQGRDIYTLAPAIEMNVRNVPEQGRPDSYTGAFGKFRVSAELTPRKVRVGDPMTLTLSVIGNGNLEDIAPPPLKSVPAISDHFKIYEATSETRDQQRVFTWSLRPSHAELTELAPIPFSYFDVDKERFVTIRTEPLMIQVEEAARMDAQEIVAARPETVSDSTTLQARTEGLFAPITDSRGLRVQSTNVIALSAYLGALGFLYLAALLMIPRWKRLREDPTHRRRRGAAPRCRERLAQFRKAVAEQNLSEASTSARLALAGVVADAAQVPEAGLTSREVRDHLTRLGVEESLGERTAKLLDDWEASLYGMPPEDLNALTTSTGDLSEQLLRALKKEGHLT